MPAARLRESRPRCHQTSADRRAGRRTASAPALARRQRRRQDRRRAQSCEARCVPKDRPARLRRGAADGGADRELVPALRDRSHQDGDETKDRNRERQQSEADGDRRAEAGGRRSIVAPRCRASPRPPAGRSDPAAAESRGSARRLAAAHRSSGPRATRRRAAADSREDRCATRDGVEPVVVDVLDDADDARTHVAAPGIVATKSRSTG